MAIIVIKAGRRGGAPGGFGRRGKAGAMAVGRLKDGEMNKTEEAYSWQLEARKLAGELVWWKFEAVKLKLAPKTYYTPDFAVMRADGRFEFHEIKGFWMDDARVKVKLAAELFPFQIAIIQKVRGAFIETERLG